MNMIAAVDLSWGIGKENSLLYHIPEDMKFFRSVTLGKTVVCGRKTLESFPGSKPLPERMHYVLTRSKFPDTDQLRYFSDLDSLLEALRILPEEDVVVIGGESVYRQLLPYCQKVYITKIEADGKEADAFFPNLDEDSSFELSESGEMQTSKNGLRFAFLVYKNTDPRR